MCAVIMLQSLLISLLSLSCINCIDIDEIISKFEEDKCIEDNFITPEIYLHTSLPGESIMLAKDVPVGKSSLSVIHELSQLNKIDYYYYLEREDGPSHSKIFYITLKLGNEVYKGDGMSIKEAKRHAAEEALLHTNYLIPEYKEKYDETVLTPTVELNNFAMKLGMKVTYLSEDELKAESFMYKQKNFTIPDSKTFKSDRINYTLYHPYQSRKPDIPKENQHGRPFKVGVIVGEMKFIGVGYTLQSARHEAAKNALLALKQFSLQDIDKCINEGIVCNSDNNKSPISWLYERAQNDKISIDFEIIDERGPAHEKEFVTKCQFGDLRVEGVGKSKKKSKRDAAEKMLEKLKYTSPSNNNSGDFSQSVKKKNKKKKVIKSRLEKFALDAKSFITSTWEAAFPDDKSNVNDDNIDGKSQKKKPQYNNEEKQNDFKQILLGFAQDKGVAVHYVDLGIENLKYYSLVFIGIEPKHVCLGDGKSYDLSRQKASAEALNFFHKLGIEGIVPSHEVFKEIQSMDFGKMYIIGNDAASAADDNSKKE